MTLHKFGNQWFSMIKIVWRFDENIKPSDKKPPLILTGLLYGVYCYYFDIPLDHITCARYIPLKPFCQLALVTFLSIVSYKFKELKIFAVHILIYGFFMRFLVHLYHECKLYEPMRNSWCHDSCFPKYFAILYTFGFS